MKLLREILSLSEDKITTIEFGGEALTYNHPNYFDFDSDIKSTADLNEFNAELQSKYPTATCIEVYIGDEETEDEDDYVGTCYWTATVEVKGGPDKKNLKSIADYVSGMLFGQYALGDAGELSTFTIDGRDFS